MIYPGKLSIISLLIFIILTSAISDERLCSITIRNVSGNTIKIDVEIADTYSTQSRGLMFRKELAKDRGMLFVFPYEKYLNFWMKNTYIPLSIAYIDQNGVILELLSMKPLDTTITYPSAKPAMYALEVNRNWFKNNGIAKGCRISFNGCLGK